MSLLVKFWELENSLYTAMTVDCRATSIDQSITEDVADWSAQLCRGPPTSTPAESVINTADVEWCSLICFLRPEGDVRPKNFMETDGERRRAKEKCGALACVWSKYVCGLINRPTAGRRRDLMTIQTLPPPPPLPPAMPLAFTACWRKA